MIDYVKKHGKNARGKKEYIKFLNGEYLSNSEAILAHCYDCSGFYEDGNVLCDDVECPLYNAMCRIKNKKPKKI